MKKIIILSAIVVSTTIVFVACKKEAVKDQNPVSKTVLLNEEKLDISIEETQQILDELNSSTKAPKWWKKFKEWVRAHSGNSQQYVNGQPACSGEGGCGPCAGICFGSGISAGGDNGEITQEEFVLGLRAIAFSIVENNEHGLDRKMLIEIPAQFESDFVMDHKFRVTNDEELPDFFVHGAGLSSIKMKAGVYPAIKSPQDGITRTIVNIDTE